MKTAIVITLLLAFTLSSGLPHDRHLDHGARNQEHARANEENQFRGRGFLTNFEQNLAKIITDGLSDITSGLVGTNSSRSGYQTHRH